MWRACPTQTTGSEINSLKSGKYLIFQLIFYLNFFHHLLKFDWYLIPKFCVIISHNELMYCNSGVAKATGIYLDFVVVKIFDAT